MQNKKCPYEGIFYVHRMIRNGLFSIFIKRYVFAFIQIIDCGVYQRAQRFKNHIRHGVDEPDFDIAVQRIAVNDNAFDIGNRADDAHLIAKQIGIDTAYDGVLLHIAL